jgi:hypothetical protein
VFGKPPVAFNNDGMMLIRDEVVPFPFDKEILHKAKLDRPGCFDLVFPALLQAPRESNDSQPA